MTDKNHMIGGIFEGSPIQRVDDFLTACRASVVLFGEVVADVGIGIATADSAVSTDAVPIVAASFFMPRTNHCFTDQEMETLLESIDYANKAIKCDEITVPVEEFAKKLRVALDKSREMFKEYTAEQLSAMKENLRGTVH